MTANIGLRLTAPNGAHIVIAPTETREFRVEITNFLGQPVSKEDQAMAIEYALVNVSALREQLFEMAGRKKPHMKPDG